MRSFLLLLCGTIAAALASFASFAQSPAAAGVIGPFSDQMANVLDPLVEARYCGPPKRDAKGVIIRRYDVLKKFQQYHPCPANGSRDINTACPGWQIDHPIPLVCGGCDAVSNMQWLPKSIKTCTDPHCKDRFEQKIYCPSAIGGIRELVP